ncbi:MAG: DUF2189 domain-containing protein [Proteobacteria bacterium]|nr:DUF2189 domain-containing protein [Pseudomonadota bacterium]
MAIRNPIEWGWAQLNDAALAFGSARRAMRRLHENLHSPAPAIGRIRTAELREVLAKGLDDFGAYRTDVIFLCFIYPLVGLVLARLAFGYDMLPLLFPLASGFALVGPFAAIGLYEMSRRREEGVQITWADAIGVTQSPAFGAVVVLGLMLVALFLIWLLVAQIIYDLTLGPEPPTSIGLFVFDVLTTQPGWTLIVVGMGVGFLFALVVLAIGTVSFPLLLDRNVGLDTAVRTSVSAVLANPVPMAVWGLIVASGLVLGSIPLFLGLIIVMPVLGHATWHLYRKLVPR